MGNSPFQRNNQIYWTLQNRRQAKPLPSNSVTCRDDLYATPIKRSERMARAAAAANAQLQNHESNGNTSNNSNNNISPIVPRNRNGAFLTSTPTRDSTDLENLRASLLRPTSQKQSDSPESLNTCADRIGQSKTSLMDFKKLLLAKSAKASPVQRKVSAVELLKKNTQPSGSISPTPTATANDTSKPLTSTHTSLKTLNSSMKLLDLSGSPKTFANRRMLRQGQFGSPSKNLTPKIKTQPNTNWRSNSLQRSEIMSSTIVEASNSEEEKSNNSGGSKSSRSNSFGSESNHSVETNYDIKQNFFIQTDENNFMRGELKNSFNRSANNTSVNKITASPTAKTLLKNSNNSTAPPTSPKNTSALETAL